MLNIASREIQKYISLLLQWNQQINLTSKNIDINQHILDCLDLMNFITHKNIHLLDIGSGAGLPGLILSIAGVEKVTLIEPNYKKYTFLLYASSVFGGKIDIINDKIEKINIDCDIVTSKAFASISNLLNYTNHIEIRDKYLIVKANNYQEEIQEAKNWHNFNYNIFNSKVLNNGKIIEIIRL